MQSLRDEEAKKVNELRSKLDETTEPTLRDQIKGEITATKRAYKMKRKDVQASLFIKST